MKPTIEQLRECFDFNERTGALTWKMRPQHHFKDAHFMNAWNARYAGRNAGTLTSEGYIRCSLMGSALSAHVICWALKHGSYPSMIDHIDGNRVNNTIANLRECSPAENSRNMKQKQNVTGLPGVRRSGRKFTAQICVNKKKIHIGTFDTADLAHAAYLSAAQQHHGAFAAKHTAAPSTADSAGTGAMGEGANHAD